MKGYRTLILNALALIYFTLPLIGIEVPAAEQQEINAGVLAIANVLMRFITTSKVGAAA